MAGTAAKIIVSERQQKLLEEFRESRTVSDTAARELGLQERAVAAGQSRGQQAGHFLAREHIGQHTRALGEVKVFDDVRSLSI